MLVAVVATAALVGLAALAIVVGRLQSRVRDLEGRLSALRAVDAEPLEQADVTPRAPAPTAGPTVALSEPADPEPSQAVPVITRLAEDVSDDLDLTTARVASVTLARPLIKVAALSHGLRRAMGEEQRMRVRYTVRSELRRQRKLRRRRRAATASAGWRP